jgi:glycosyltransferase involved in cell wall biosynthesis
VASAQKRRSAMKFLFGTVAYHQHAQNIARALYEADALYAYASTGVDPAAGSSRGLRAFVSTRWPRLDRELSKRAVTEVPSSLVRARWRWEIPRVLGSRLRWDERLVDWCWERGELDFDRACAAQVPNPGIGGFLGVEYSALASLETARRFGKPAVLAFFSPHYATFARWVEPEYERFPQLKTRSQDYFARVTPYRNERRDREASIADWLVTNSAFTTESLAVAGYPREKILTVALGGPPPVHADRLPATRPAVTRFLYVGPASIRKGAHYLLRTWRRVAGPDTELHFYGSMQLPDALRREAESAAGGSSIHFHGSVPSVELGTAYLQSSVLVLPTLCDGFGMVVTEALAHGLPVITTRNAGAADVIAQSGNGFVIPAADEDALAETMSWVADHPTDIFDMRSTALASAARWTWNEFRVRLVDALDASVGGVRDRSLATA